MADLLRLSSAVIKLPNWNWAWLTASEPLIHTFWSLSLSNSALLSPLFSSLRPYLYTHTHPHPSSVLLFFPPVLISYLHNLSLLISFHLLLHDSVSSPLSLFVLPLHPFLFSFFGLAVWSDAVLLDWLLVFDSGRRYIDTDVEYQCVCFCGHMVMDYITASPPLRGGIIDWFTEKSVLVS